MYECHLPLTSTTKGKKRVLKKAHEGLIDLLKNDGAHLKETILKI